MTCIATASSNHKIILGIEDFSTDDITVKAVEQDADTLLFILKLPVS